MPDRPVVWFIPEQKGSMHCTAPPHDSLCRLSCEGDEEGRRHPVCAIAALMEWFNA